MLVNCLFEFWQWLNGQRRLEKFMHAKYVFLEEIDCTLLFSKEIQNFLEFRARLIRETSDILAQLAREKLLDER